MSRKFIHLSQVGFIPKIVGCFIIYKSLNIIYNINRLKRQTQNYSLYKTQLCPKYIFFHYESPANTKDTRDIAQHNEDNL